MRHQADDVPPSVTDTRDRLDRSVWIRLIGRIAGGVDVAEYDLPVLLERSQHVRRSEVVALAVGDWNTEDLPRAARKREGRIGLLNTDVHVLAPELQAAIAQHRAGEQTRLEENLEAVTDAENRPALASELSHGVHDG